VLEGKKVGTATITASTNGHSVTREVTVTPGAPAKIIKVSGDNQVGIINENLLANLVVQVTDVNDNNIATATSVSWRLNSATASSFSTTSAGVGSVSVKAPSTTGASTVTATLNTSAVVTFNFTT